MARYSIVFKKSVAKDLRNLPKKDIRKILSQIDALKDNPRGEGCIKLSAQERYRVRVGIYRILYEIQDAKLLIHVVKVGHRSNIYKSRS